MTAATCGIILFDHFSAKNFTILPWGKLSKLGVEGVVATLRCLLLLLRPKYCCYVLETSGVCYNFHFLSKLTKTPSKSHIPRILAKN